jgi:hypothetical protein
VKQIRAVVESQLSSHFDAKLVRELLEGHAEVKRNYYLGGLRLAEVEGGRFCEAAFRLLQQAIGDPLTPLSKMLDTEKLIGRLQNIASAAHPESIRLHIPRALRLVYDIRNKRDAAHLADGIDPNLQDATLVVSVVDWILAEFLRLNHNVSADEARQIVEMIVARVAPIVQDFDGFLKILNPRLNAGDMCLVLLYQCGAGGATYDQVSAWIRPEMRTNLKRTLGRLVHDLAFAHVSGNKYLITRSGQKEVETRRLVEPA